jgi:hypothetical protein
MKRIFGFLLFMALTAMGFAQNDASGVDGPAMQFESLEVDYGTIENGADGMRKFVFTNVGTEPLVIKNARGSCGCTVPTWPKEPIMPGETSAIEVKYDTKRQGKINKTITLTTNESIGTRMLTIKGEVLPAPKDEPVPASKSSILNK